MPTQPLETLLYRDLSKAAAKDMLQVASPLLQELVNYGTNVFARCRDAAVGEPNEHLAVLLLYLHVVEMTDGVEVLLAKSCPTPAVLLVRSAFEALLSMLWILEKDYQRRSLAWVYEYGRQRVATYEKLDPSTNRGKDFQKLMTTDFAGRDIKLPPVSKVRVALANMQHFVDRDQFTLVAAEMRRLKGKGKNRRQPAWHELFGGPRTLDGLARRFGKGTQYEFFYRHWSSIAHAQDVSRFIAKSPEGLGSIRQLRDPELIYEVMSNSASIFIEGTRLLLAKFRPEEVSGGTLAKWYIEEVRPRYWHIIGRR